MNSFFKIFAAIIIIIIIVCGISFLGDRKSTSYWVIKVNKTDSAGIAWARFKWSNDSLGGKYYKRTAMIIPAEIIGIPFRFTFQFDLGASTEIYETTARSIFEQYPELNRIHRLKSILQFWNTKKSIKDLEINFGNITAINRNVLLETNYGESVDLTTITDSSEVQIGTIGADLFQNKVLIIDYPNQRFAICNSLPNFYKDALIDIELDNSGRVILPMIFKNKKYKLLFDNGSSMFPLLVSDNKTAFFSTAKVTDTIKISSWGKMHNVIGRPFTDTFQLGAQFFSNIKIYSDFRKEYRTDAFDAITGNVLFWNKTIVIDFKNKKFGIK
jgi:hypothetical protein